MYSAASTILTPEMRTQTAAYFQGDRRDEDRAQCGVQSPCSSLAAAPCPQRARTTETCRSTAVRSDTRDHPQSKRSAQVRAYGRSGVIASQADSASSILVTRSIVKAQVEDPGLFVVRGEWVAVRCRVPDSCQNVDRLGLKSEWRGPSCPPDHAQREHRHCDDAGSDSSQNGRGPRTEDRGPRT